MELQAKYAQPSIGMIYSYFRDTQCHTGLQYVIKYYIKCLVVPIIIQGMLLSTILYECIILECTGKNYYKYIYVTIHHMAT